MKELSFEQMESINGGGWVGDALRGIADAIVCIWGWIFTRISEIGWSVSFVGSGNYSTSSGDFNGSMYTGMTFELNY